MNEIDQICDQEIALLNERISSADNLRIDVSNLIKETYIVRASLDLASEYANRDNYVEAYRSMLNALSYLININQQIIDKYSDILSIVKNSDETI